jgi:hypothetical protein
MLQMLRCLLISILEEEYMNIDPGDWTLLYLLGENLGPAAVFAIVAQVPLAPELQLNLMLSQLNTSMEDACKPVMEVWPRCYLNDWDGQPVWVLEVMNLLSEP